jgi:hypothetical protein
MEAKRYKLMPHLFFPDADVTLWVDGNIWLKATPDAIAVELLGDADMALFGHPYRQNVWQEFDALAQQKRFQIPYLQQQLAKQQTAYRMAGLPRDAPLFECSVLVRRNNLQVRTLMESWWTQICRWQWRDQVSLPYVLWKHGGVGTIKVNQGNVRDHHLFAHVSQY